MKCDTTQVITIIEMSSYAGRIYGILPSGMNLTLVGDTCHIYTARGQAYSLTGHEFYFFGESDKVRVDGVVDTFSGHQATLQCARDHAHRVENIGKLTMIGIGVAILIWTKITFHL